MAVEHTFLGTWEIICCTFEGKPEISGLEGIKFRLDDSGDITWYNDLVSPHPESKDCNTCCDSASVLFSCETFDVNVSNPRLVFGTFAGYSIDFKTNTLTPADMLILDCEDWYMLECRRLKEGNEAGQENQFSFAEPLTECYFSDMMIKSLDGVDYCVHSSVLRLSGFDCSMCVQAPPTIHATASHTPHPRGREQTRKICEQICTDVRTPKTVKIQVNSVETRDHCNEEQQNPISHKKLSPIYLQLPAEHQKNHPRNERGNLNAYRTHQLSSSFNCLSTATKTTEVAESALATKTSKSSNSKGCSEGERIGDSVCDLLTSNMRRFPPTSNSDSHLESQTQMYSRNIFNFCQEVLANPIETTSACNTRRPPLSPYRVRSPSPFPSSLDTPPSSPLTPIGVLHNLPAFILTPILHWLYTESLMPDLDEEVCEKLINFVETQPSLMRMMAPVKNYQKLILLKKYVVNIIMDLHHILDCIIKTINPLTISHEPELLYNTFKDCLRDGAVGCAKVLQFCNIFIKDAADISRNQKNEIIKYVRTRIPVFIMQFYQLLKNVLNVFISLDEKEKIELVNFLVPEIEITLTTLTDVIEELKNSLEKMCKDLNCSHLALSLQQKSTVEYVALFQLRKTNTNYIAQTELLHDNPNLSPSNESASLFRRSRRSTTSATSLALYGDLATNKQHLTTTENDLKFVLYMYEVRKMRDIYGRIATALDVIRDKKTTFCGMDLASKRSTIQQNLEQLIIDIPGYLIAMENLLDTLDENLGKKEFKFCFKLATSQINGVIGKLFDHRAALKSSLCQICRLVRRREFLQSLVDIGLLESANILQNESTDDHERVCVTTSRYSSAPRCQISIVNGRHEYDYKKIKLNLIEHLCEPPIVANSNLSKNALRLLHSSQLTDMEFEVHTIAAVASIPGVVINSNKNDLDVSSEIYHQKGQASTASATQAVSQSVQIHTFRAHRVIVSSRCEWFKMALLSGMQESITRKIIITDTSSVIFRRLLLYLYGAPIDRTVGAEQICELMLLADRYSIDDLKTICENMLNTFIDEESVVCLLGIAERYRADVLKNNCFAFLQQHANITRSELFKELPRSIQLEAKDRIRWYQRTPEPWSDGLKSRNGSRHSLKSPSKPRSRSRKSSPSYI